MWFKDTFNKCPLSGQGSFTKAIQNTKDTISISCFSERIALYLTSARSGFSKDIFDIYFKITSIKIIKVYEN